MSTLFSKIYNFWQILKSNLWFVPATMCMFAFILVFGIYKIESSYFLDSKLHRIFLNIEIQDAKTMVTALLSAMITMATLAISVTMVALSLSASQLGPRLIKVFMSDRKTQYFIGMFFGVVIACFALAIILHNSRENNVNFQVTVSTVFSLCFINLFVLLGFINHVARSCVADNVILRVSNDLRRATKRITLQNIKNQEQHKKPSDKKQKSWAQMFKDKKINHFYFSESGYIQNINYASLARIAQEHNFKINVKIQAGEFVIGKQDGVGIYPANALNETTIKDIDECFIIGNSRTPTQDVAYSIRHLVEIAIRALSPGINDSFTAITVIDNLSAALADLFETPSSDRWIMNDAGEIVLFAKTDSEADIVFEAYDQIRHSARDLPHVLVYLKEKLETLKTITERSSVSKALSKELKSLNATLDKCKTQ